MVTLHRLRRTWSDRVDVYVALSEFARDKFIQGGLPARKLVVKPNFVRSDPGPGTGQGRYALFVGRLAAGKGVRTLLRAGEALRGQVPLKIVGDGPLAGEVAGASRRAAGVEWLGPRPHAQVLALMKEAWALVFPSLYYENFPTVIAEAYATGLPVIASSVGSVSRLVQHARTGLHVRPDDPADLAAALRWLWARPEERTRLGRNARVEFERNYTAARNYELLREIYARAIQQSAFAGSRSMRSAGAGAAS
jgi:glycosyltransferase involved in cell wall biosynthesis